MEQDRIWDHFQTKQVDSFDHARGRYAWMAAEVRRRLGRSGGSVLNIGAGPAVLERLLLSQGRRVAVLDPSEATIEALSKLPVDARCGYAQQMSFESGSFDLVVASEVLEHIEPATRRQVLAEVTRVLAPGGWFVGSVPYREVLSDQQVVCPDCGKIFHRWGHVSSFDLPTIESELAESFVEVSCRRLSFVDWGNARTPLRLFKGVVQGALGRLGQAIASPSIAFAARWPHKA